MTETITSTVVTTYSYNSANQLVTVRASGDGITWHYTFDQCGNLVRQTPGGTTPAEGEIRYTYDDADQLVQVELYTSGEYTTLAEAAYNGDGHRVRKVADGVTTTYVIAVLGLPQVVVETTSGVSTTYLYGHDLLGEEGTAWAWHLGDGLGSVRQLADGDGDVTLAQGYTPFGVLLWREGSGVSVYGYTGEQEDGSTQLVFLRARYYDPYLNRFISPDTIIPDFTHPQNLNRYMYAYNNPVNRVDPSGEYPVDPSGCTHPPPAPTLALTPREYLEQHGRPDLRYVNYSNLWREIEKNDLESLPARTLLAMVSIGEAQHYNLKDLTSIMWIARTRVKFYAFGEFGYHDQLRWCPLTACIDISRN